MGKFLSFKKIFVVYCAIFASAIAIAGFTTVGEKNFVAQIIFLPVPLFFLFSAFSSVKKRGKKAETSEEKTNHLKNTMLYGFIFFVLVTIALINILSANR